MVFKKISVFVLWMKVASALQGLIALYVVHMIHRSWGENSQEATPVPRGHPSCACTCMYSISDK